MKKMFKKLRIKYHYYMVSVYHDLYYVAKIDGDNKEMARINALYEKHYKKLAKLGDEYAKKLGF